MLTSVILSIFVTAVPVIFNTSSSYARICFFILAIKWPALMMHWQRVEKRLPHYETIREQSELAYKIKMTSIIVMTLSLGKIDDASCMGSSIPLLFVFSLF